MKYLSNTVALDTIGPYFGLSNEIETDAENLRLVFLLINEKQLMIQSNIKLEVKTIGQEL